MKLLVQAILILSLITARSLPAEVTGLTRKGQEKINSSVHEKHNISSKSSPHGDVSSSEDGQQNLIKIIRKGHDISIEVSPHKDYVASELEKPAPESKGLSSASPVAPAKKTGPDKVPLKLEDKYNRMILSAWKKYKAGQYIEAINLFSVAANRSRISTTRNKAYLGLGYSLKEMGNPGDAAKMFEMLAAKHYAPGETLPVLMELLVSNGDWSGAEKYLARLPREERLIWKYRIGEARFGQEFESLVVKNDMAPLEKLVDDNAQLLEQCRVHDSFFEAAAAFAGYGEHGRAMDIYEKILRCREDWELRLHVHHEIEKNLPVGRALASVNREMEGKGWNSEYMEMLADIRMRLLLERFAGIKEGTPEYFVSAMDILKHDPGNDDVRSSLAWYCFEHEDYNCSYEHFSILQRKAHYNPEYLKGLIYSLVNAGRSSEALDVLESGTILPAAELGDLKHGLYYKLGDSAYNLEDYERSEQLLVKALDVKPENADTINLLAWTYYRQEKYEKALDLFNRSYMIDRSPEAAANAELAFERLSPEDKDKTVKQASGGEEPLIQELSADWHYENKAPITAAHFSTDQGTCYWNCDTPVIEVAAYFRDKSGDPGFSKLEELSIPIRLHYPVRTGREWIFEITPIYLDSGSAPDRPYAGHFYRFLDDSSSFRRPLTDSLWVYEPEIGYRVEGLVDKEFRIGLTPLEGIVDPALRFKARVKKKDSWFIQVHQDSVRESILSYVGLEDPYGEEEWGRVLKTGVKGGMTFPLSTPYWISFDAGYDYLWGENVVDNQSFALNVSAGRTDRIWKGERNLGLFLSMKHYKENTSFFTYGHGGYFSPDKFLLIGPFARYTSDECCDWWVDGELSVGYMYYSSEDAPHYHEVNDNPALLNSAARADLFGMYRGESETGIGVNANGKVMKLISEHLAVGGYGRLNTSADYEEYQLGVLLHYYFDPKNKLCHMWDVFHRPEEHLE